MSVIVYTPEGQEDIYQQTKEIILINFRSTTSIDALKFELSLVQKAMEAGHKDPATAQRGRQVGLSGRTTLHMPGAY